VRTLGGAFTTFDVPGAAAGQSMIPTSINPAGEITGWFTDVNGHQRGFVRSR